VTLRVSQSAFVSAPARTALRGSDVAAVAGGVAAVATPGAAHAFVYNGTEYFDVFFGIDPAWWGVLIFCIIYCGAVLKNAVEKYNLPRGGNPDLLKPAKTGKFLGKEIEVETYNQ